MIRDIAADDLRRAVGRGVVDDHDLVANRSLGAGRAYDIECALDVAGFVIAGNEKCDEWRHL